MKAALLSASTLSGEELAAIRDRLRPAELVPITLNDVRHGGLRLVRSLPREAIFLYPQSRALAAAMRVVALCSGARQIWMLDAELRHHPIPRAEAIRDLGQTLKHSLLGWGAWLACELDTQRLLSASRRPARRKPGPVAYLKANLNPGLKAGGSVTHTAGVVNGLLQLGHQVRLFAPDELPLVPLPTGRLTVPKGFGFPADLNLFRLDRLNDRPLGCGWIYQRYSRCSLLGVRLSRRENVPLVLEYNGSEAWIQRVWVGQGLLAGTVARMEEANLRHAHLIVTVSEVLREELLERGVETERVLAHPNGVDPERYRVDPCPRARYGLPEDKPLVGFLGTFGPWHGAEILAEAAEGFPEAHFVLMGDGPQRRAIQPRENLTLTGLIDPHQVPAHLAMCDVLVSPHVPNRDGTRFFGSPTKIFEYMAAGKAILASDLEQMGEVLRGVAVLFEPGSRKSLEQGLQSLLADPALRSALGRKARQRVEQRYTWRHHVAAVLERLP